jgi:hypothetical protein
MGAAGRRKSVGLSTEWVNDELVIYDEATQVAHCLSADAARVFEQCDGERSGSEIALAVGIDRQTVDRALEHLAESGLLDEPAGYSRRDVAKRFAKVGGAAVAAPLIYSVAIPAAAAAISCIPPQFACGTSCCSDQMTQRCCGTTCCDISNFCCNDACCATPFCCNGTCCHGSGCCGGTCCTSGQALCAGDPCQFQGQCCNGAACENGFCVGP